MSSSPSSTSSRQDLFSLLHLVILRRCRSLSGLPRLDGIRYSRHPRLSRFYSEPRLAILHLSVLTAPPSHMWRATPSRRRPSRDNSAEPRPLGPGLAQAIAPGEPHASNAVARVHSFPEPRRTCLHRLSRSRARRPLSLQRASRDRARGAGQAGSSCGSCSLGRSTAMPEYNLASDLIIRRGWG